MNKLGGSKDAALKRLHSLEKRFNRGLKFKAQYVQFLQEYLALGHMEQIEDSSERKGESFYLPHHGIFKSPSQTSNIRVVFDASNKTTTGSSLNDVLMVGPVVQQDLMLILLRFRTFKYVFAADIIKMYRQILLNPDHTRYQRILWREDPTSEIKTYELSTVTYGTSSASYLATRCLKHLAESNSNEFPLGSICVQRDFYVDDLLTGADTIDEAKQTRNEIIKLLRLGGFELSKWATNTPELLECIDNQNRNAVIIRDGVNSRILGMHWNQDHDVFYFSYIPDQNKNAISKRTILSEVSRLFDPLGLLGPTIVLAKLILQDLWQAGTHWDESVPPDIKLRWVRLRSQLSNINQLRIPRCIKFNIEPRSIQIHGFCDASQRAFGACVYLRSQLGDNTFRCELISSKSRVAPLKAVSLPRLELSAALLLARLIDKINTSFNLNHIKVFLWSDSTIALNWIASPSRKWTVFVANKVGEIQRLTRPDSWRHISSTNNPADILSRGINPNELADSSIWWNGPAFLTALENCWPNSEFQTLKGNISELAQITVNVVTVERSIIEDLLNKISNLNKILRIIAYVLRFCRTKTSNRFTTFISHKEITAALIIVCRAVQKSAFPEEYKSLNKKENIHTSSSLLSLSPFIDENGLGGRLKYSGLSSDVCHPILLPKGHKLTKLIIEQEHARTAHAGVQATMASVKQRFWPLSLRSITRGIVQKCIVCFKNKPTASEAIIGSLPSDRVTVSRPFFHCDVDYAGPLLLHESKRRNARHSKTYVAIFVCFTTKAVHIEFVSDLTSEAFIAALRRFIARRGKPACIYSDNGTTFVEANRLLKELYELINCDQLQDDVQRFLRKQETSWKFVPPNAPHFGGLWEAAVKSTKHHLYRIIGLAHLTFEEMCTVLYEIEAILNSRPLTQLSNDPNDLAYLTLGNFLVGTPLNGIPNLDLCDTNKIGSCDGSASRSCDNIFGVGGVQNISTLYRNVTSGRPTGLTVKGQQLVLLKQQDLAPLHWRLGRVEAIHTDPDGIARLATLKTLSTTLVRPLTKIAILPLEA